MDEAAAKELKRRILTNLHNSRPASLDGLHVELASAVLAAGRWPHSIEDDESLQWLLAPNLERAGGEN